MKLLVVAMGAAIAAIGVAGFVAPSALLDWWSRQGLLFMRAWAGVAILFGLFVVHAVPWGRGTRQLT
jgi:hypothetical protein